MTEWRVIPNFPKYKVSEFGTIIGPRGELYHFYRKGYARVQIGGLQRVVSRLMCEAFYGPPPTPKHQAAHEDGDKTNNSISNLSWKTPQQNADDVARHGSLKGERHGRAKLSAEDILDIKALYANGHKLVEIHKEYGQVCYATISHICHNRNWAHTA